MLSLVVEGVRVRPETQERPTTEVCQMAFRVIEACVLWEAKHARGLREHEVRGVVGQCASLGGLIEAGREDDDEPRSIKRQSSRFERASSNPMTALAQSSPASFLAGEERHLRRAFGCRDRSETRSDRRTP